MDLHALDTAQWHTMTQAIWWLWAWVPLVVTFAFCFMTALAIIPSLVVSRQLSRRTLAFRAPLLLLGLVSLVGAVASIATALNTAEFVTNLYPRWLI